MNPPEDVIDDESVISEGWQRSYLADYDGSEIVYFKEGLSFSAFVKGVPVKGNYINGRKGTGEYINGTDGDDVLDGKGGPDTIFGRDGNDQIYYYGTGEIIDAGAGHDTLRVMSTVKGVDFKTLKNFEVVLFDNRNYSGRATDIDASSLNSALTVIGNAGSSKIKGSKGKNVIDGGGGNDTIWGSSGFSVGNPCQELAG